MSEVSSNWLEFENIEEILEEEGTVGNLTKGAMISLFTYNSTTTNASLFKKGNSTSQKLFDLVVPGCKLEISYEEKFIISLIFQENV
jgi:hypothetical protein